VQGAALCGARCKVSCGRIIEGVGSLKNRILSAWGHGTNAIMHASSKPKGLVRGLAGLPVRLTGLLLLGPPKTFKLTLEAASAFKPLTMQN